MGEQRFKVGDWVRVMDNKGAPYDYRVGDICQVSAVRKDLVYCGDAAMFAKRFEPWQPRVGERVKVNYGHGWNGEGEVSRYVGESAVVLMETGNFSGRVGGFNVSHLEPITEATTPAKSATIKIEAGKFYRTRDGRKVGPIVVAQGRGEPWSWKSCYGWNTYYFKEDGFSCPGSIHYHRDADDIIAEWIDEPLAKPSNDNAKPKFKVGDRVRMVRIVDGNKSEITATVVYDDGSASLSNNWQPLVIKFDEHVSWAHSAEGRVPDGFGYWVTSDDIELITPPTPTTSIVALIENGQPKPSSTPYVHTSTGAAEKEAKRLAAKYKGKQFGVFTLTTTHEEAAPVYDHKWQNMAALGLKIDAIKELRAVAGLTLKGAKDAVEAWIEYENAA